MEMTAPACHPGVTVYSAQFVLNRDIAGLFPYINAVAEETVYFETPDTIQFKLDNRRCALYPTRLVAGGFNNRDEAVAFFDIFAGFLRKLANEKENITPNHKRHKPVPVMSIFKLLPKTNCGECGQPTCLAFAAALSKSDISAEACPTFCGVGNELAEKLAALFQN